VEDDTECIVENRVLRVEVSTKYVCCQIGIVQSRQCRVEDNFVTNAQTISLVRVDYSCMLFKPMSQ
jgi:hypothetical protein